MTAEGQANSDDILEAIGFATALRVSAREQRATYARDVVVLFEQLSRRGSELLPVAQAIVEPGLGCALSDALQVLAATHTDPAMPGLEADYVSVLGELSALAVVFANDADESTESYRRLTEAALGLMRAAETVRPIWRVIRLGLLAARRKPPTRARCAEPHADPKEYYM
jgi:hypothetical protein